jgi:hypothetical protein
VGDDYGVFVDGTSGTDPAEGEEAGTQAGTKTSPFKTIGAALAHLGDKSKVFVCEGTYPESVTLPASVSLYGGFACGSWEYACTTPKVAPAGPGVALTIADASSVEIVDLSLESKDASTAGTSSIAVFVSDSTNVTFRRVTATAGDGKSANPAGAPATNHDSASLNGNDASDTKGGDENSCTCKTWGSSKGGKGGNPGEPNAEEGKEGLASPKATIVAPYTSAGGVGFPDNAGECGGGIAGSNGAPRDPGVGASALGILSSAGWSPASGTSGEAGNPGAGGGGGGGSTDVGGGGGGCGGCGGAGGLGGQGGGASIAVASYQSSLVLEACMLTSGKAGNGGKGGTGEAGAGGGGRGGPSGACPGGRGGNGAGGSGGGGGAGGISAAVLQFEGSFTRDGATVLTSGEAGDGGGGGEGGEGGKSNPPGLAEKGSSASPGLDGDTKDLLVLP